MSGEDEVREEVDEKEAFDKLDASLEQGGSRKMIVFGLVAGILLVCALAAIAFVVISGSGLLTPAHTLKLQLAGNGTVSDDQLSQTGRVLQDRFKATGADASVSTSRDGNGKTYALVSYGNLTRDEAQAIATAPGVFEMRIQAQANQSEHMLYGDGIETVGDPMEFPPGSGSNNWGVTLKLTPAGAQQFHDVASKYDILGDPENHTVVMLLDGKVVYTAPLSASLAIKIVSTPVDTVMASIGPDYGGKAMALQLKAILQGGELPVRLTVVD